MKEQRILDAFFEVGKVSGISFFIRAHVLIEHLLRGRRSIDLGGALILAQRRNLLILFCYFTQRGKTTASQQASRLLVT